MYGSPMCRVWDMVTGGLQDQVLLGQTGPVGLRFASGRVRTRQVPTLVDSPQGALSRCGPARVLRTVRRFRSHFQISRGGSGTKPFMG